MSFEKGEVDAGDPDQTNRLPSMSNKDSAATCQHANLMPVTSQGSVYVSRCTSCNEVRVDSDWQKDSAAEQRCVKCNHSNVGLSGYCIKNLPDAYGDFRYGPLCGCKCSFSEAAASEGVPSERTALIRGQQRNGSNEVTAIMVSRNCPTCRVYREALETISQKKYDEWAFSECRSIAKQAIGDDRVRAYTGSLPERLHAALHTLWTKAVEQEGYIKAEWRELDDAIFQSIRDSVDEAAVRRAAERIKTHIRIYLSKDVADLLSTHDITEIITTELQKGK